MIEKEFNILWETIQNIQKHTCKMNDEFGAIQAKVEILMKVFWLILTLSVTSVATSIWNLIIQ